MDKKKAILYGSAGAGTLLLGYLIYRALSKSDYTGLKGEPKITPLNSTSTTSVAEAGESSMNIPALAIIHDDYGEYAKFALNYTPQANPDQSDQISIEDYERLQTVGIIPQGFPREQIVAVPSHNGRNWFFVGYSDPYSIRTNRDNLTVIQPKWAVSYGRNFDNSGIPPDDMDSPERFYDVALRTLFAEWMLTNRGVDGCHRGQTLSACNAERGAILNILLQRTALKKERIRENLDSKSVIYGPGIRWNKGRTFMDSYEGPITSRAQDRFNEFYLYDFWQMPQYSGQSTGFIHPLSMSRSSPTNPPWIKTTDPLAAGYLANHVIELGSAVFSDRSRRFK